MKKPKKSDLLLKLSCAENLTLEHHKVGEYLIARLSFDEPKHIPQREIGDFLGMQQPNVSRTMKDLVDFGLIEEGSKIASGNQYILKSEI